MRRRVLVTDKAGDLLPTEVEYGDIAHRDLVLHSKVPAISSITDTPLYIYWDRTKKDRIYFDTTDEVEGESAVAVWDDNFKSVVHMVQMPTRRSYYTNVAEGVEAARLLAYPVANRPRIKVDTPVVKGITFDASLEQFLEKPSDFSVRGLSAFTIEALCRPTGTPTNNFTVFNEFTDNTDYKRVSLRTPTSPDKDLEFSVRVDSTGTLHIITAAASLVADTLYHVVGIFDSVEDELRLFVNGVEETPVSATMAAIQDTAPIRASTIGALNESIGDSRHFNGSIAEFRLSDTVRSDAWIKATHEALFGNMIAATYSEEFPTEYGPAFRVLINNVWREVSVANLAVSGVWKAIQNAFVAIGGQFRRLGGVASTISFTTTTTTTTTTTV
jgi:hypothetical protein